MMEYKLQKGCVLLFSGIFSVIWAGVWLLCAVGMSQTKKICLLAALLLAAFSAAVWMTGKISRKKQKEQRFWRALSGILLLLIGAGLLFAGRELKVYPGWDFGAVWQGAEEIAENGVFSESSNWYFTTYPNNVAL